jgi:hypothetical protein
MSLAGPDMDPNIASDLLEKTHADFVEVSPPRPPLGGEKRGHFFFNLRHHCDGDSGCGYS